MTTLPWDQVYRYVTGIVFLVLFVILILQNRRTSARLVQSEHEAQRDRLLILKELQTRQDRQDQDLAKISAEIEKNTQLTIEATQASTTALDSANHLNEKIADSHDTIVKKIDDLMHPDEK